MPEFQTLKQEKLALSSKILQAIISALKLNKWNKWLSPSQEIGHMVLQHLEEDLLLLLLPYSFNFTLF